MNLPIELLEQARHFLTRHRRRPRQASLRRAASAAYYALFHLLIEESSRIVMTGSSLNHLQSKLGRAFTHGEMKDVAQAFASGNLPTEIAAIVRAAPAADRAGLELVAKTFVGLQQSRHEADYNTGRSFGPSETGALVESARIAFRAWRLIRATPAAEAFLISLLVGKRWNRP